MTCTGVGFSIQNVLVRNIRANLSLEKQTNTFDWSFCRWMLIFFSLVCLQTRLWCFIWCEANLITSYADLAEFDKVRFIANGTGTAPIMTPPLITTTYNASAQTVTFSRPLNMSYASMLPINKCLYLIFPVGGATVVNMSVSLNSPVVFTPSPMCLHLCGGIDYIKGSLW